jgi:1-deoxy-D-xylulose-5-phosphate synthase
VALHYVFNTPSDRLVWDVGHQAYPHKLLTGRRDRLDSIKQHGGLAPFPSRAESEYDTFGVGHSSTSISAALGMAVAAELNGDARKVVAIIGDGALTGGMAWEALLNAGARKTNLIVVLNDNDMSISENVGALSNYFTKVLSGRMYSTLRKGGKKILKQMPTMWELARRSEEMMKGMVLPGTIFEELGVNYIGPMNGHDIKELVDNLRNIRDYKTDGPQLLHVVTRKGKGYDPAEKDPIKWHGPGPFDPKSGTIFKEKASGPSYSQIFGQWLCDMAAADPRIVGITPAMREGSGLVEYRRNSAALFRRGHRRAARGNVRGRPRLRRPEARGGYLLDLPATRLRPADPRRGVAEPARGVRAGPRRAWSVATAPRTRVPMTTRSCAAFRT